MKLAYLELYGQNARLAGMGAITYPDAASTDGHEGARWDLSSGSFKGAYTTLQTAKTTRPERGPTAA